MPMFFCYEHGHTIWCAAVYHDAPPPKQMEYRRARSAAHEVPADCIDELGRPDLDTLRARFPAPADAP